MNEARHNFVPLSPASSMLRHLYRTAVRLHPLAFRRKFGDEMLSIFDETNSNSARLGMLLDSLVSLLRQWILRPEFWIESSANPSLKVADGIPSFSSLDGFRPRPSAVIDGAILSAALFVITCFAIRYSWIRVLHVQIPEYQVESYLGIHHATPTELRGSYASDSEQHQTKLEPGLISERLKVDVMPVEAAPVNTSSPVSTLKAPAMPVAPPILGRPIELRLLLESYAGTYVCHSPRLLIRISVKDDQLSMRMGNTPTVTLSPTSETRFTIEGAEDRSIEFFPDSNGKTQRLQLTLGGQTITAERQ